MNNPNYIKVAEIIHAPEELDYRNQKIKELPHCFNEDFFKRIDEDKLKETIYGLFDFCFPVIFERVPLFPQLRISDIKEHELPNQEISVKMIMRPSIYLNLERIQAMIDLLKNKEIQNGWKK